MWCDFDMSIMSDKLSKCSNLINWRFSIGRNWRCWWWSRRRHRWLGGQRRTKEQRHNLIGLHYSVCQCRLWQILLRSPASSRQVESPQPPQQQHHLLQGIRTCRAGLCVTHCPGEEEIVICTVVEWTTRFCPGGFKLLTTELWMWGFEILGHVFSSSILSFFTRGSQGT